jgi:hypothetical protein
MVFAPVAALTASVERKYTSITSEFSEVFTSIARCTARIRCCSGVASTAPSFFPINSPIPSPPLSSTGLIPNFSPTRSASVSLRSSFT